MKLIKSYYLLTFLILAFLSCNDDKNDPVPVIKPIIGSVVPATGSKGTEVIITGANFSTDPSKVVVKINGKNALITSVSETVIKVNVAAKTGTGFVVVEANGQGTTGPLFTYIYTVSVSTYSGFSGAPGYVDGISSNASFHSPRGLTFDSQDNLYVADELNHCIRKVSPGGDVTTFAGSGVAGFADGDPAVAKFRNPYDVAIDEINGSYYVADKLNHCIRRLSFSGYVTTAAGIPATPGYVDAPGASARFNNPTGITVKGELADVFVTDAGNHCIRKMDNLDIVTTFAGSTTPGQLDGNGSSAQFTYPSDIYFDSTGFLYVTDRDNHNIRKISLGGTVSTVAGAGSPGWLDGAGTVAHFNSPMGLMSENGTIYVGDFNNNRIRKIDQVKKVSTIAGTGNQGFGDGDGSQALFKNPSGIAINSEGDYFISDTGNHSIRKVVID